MAVRARDSVTLAQVTEVAYTRRYYKLVAGTASAPAAPTAVPPDSSWANTEPGYTPGSSDVLYVVDVTVLTDQTFDYTPVSKSSAYEAARQAYNLANTANENATSGPVIISRLIVNNATLNTLVAQEIAARSAEFLSLNAGQITSGTLNTGVLNAASVAAAVGSFLSLNADQITAGTLDTNRLNATTVAAAVATLITISAAQITTGKLAADRLIMGVGGNLSQDPLFQSPTSWTGTNSWITPTGGKYAGGTITIPASSTTQIIYQQQTPDFSVVVKPGQMYRLDAIFTSAAAMTAANRIAIYVRYRNSAGTWQTATSVVSNSGTVSANTEVLLSTTVTVPAGMGLMSVGYAKMSTLNGITKVIDHNINLVTSGATLAPDAIDGKTITGATIRTASTGQRVELSQGADNLWGLKFFDQIGSPGGQIVNNNGGLYMRGGVDSGLYFAAELMSFRRHEQVTFNGDIRFDAMTGVAGNGQPEWEAKRWRDGNWRLILDDTGWVEVTLLSGWSVVSGWLPPAVRKKDGIIRLRSRISGTATNIMRLPDWARPPHMGSTAVGGDVHTAIADAGGAQRVAVYAKSPANITNNIDGIVFLAGSSSASNLVLQSVAPWSVD